MDPFTVRRDKSITAVTALAGYSCRSRPFANSRANRQNPLVCRSEWSIPVPSRAKPVGLDPVYRHLANLLDSPVFLVSDSLNISPQRRREICHLNLEDYH